MLDDELIKLALFEESEARRVSDLILRKDPEHNLIFRNAVGLLGQMSKETSRKLSDDQIKSYERDARVLGDIVYSDDDYFGKGKSETEVALDVHLQKWFERPQVKNDGDPSSDPNNLLLWLERLNPLAGFQGTSE